MHARAIGTGAALRSCVAVLTAAVFAGACTGEDPDAGPSDFAVRGTALGVLVPVGLELRLGDDVERLSVARDGTFAFETRLEPGASYAVALADPAMPCVLRDQAGTIERADTAIELTCTGASLASVVVSGIAPTITLVPGTTDYVVELPLSQPAVTLTATVATDGDTLAIAGTPMSSGASSVPFALRLGDTPVDIVVENDLGWQRTYRLTLRRAAALAQYARGKASDAEDGDELGWSVALSGDTLAVGAPEEDGAATGVDGDQPGKSVPASGAVYVFRRAGTVWQQEAYLKASNTGPGDHFGWSVTLSGDTLAVGATGEDSAAQGAGGNQASDAAADSGAVYVFRRIGAAWQQEAYLKASNTGAGDGFGSEVALSGDTLAVGATGEDSAAQGAGGDQASAAAPDSGAVYVFQRAGTAWQQQAYLKPSNTGAGDSFGIDVALAGDMLAVGADQEDSAATGVGGDQDDDRALDSGAVYVFQRAGTVWQQEVYLKASSTGPSSFFGRSVALSGDTLAIGSHGESDAIGGPSGDPARATGAVYVFRRAGTAWQQEAYLEASNADIADLFGWSVALSGDTLAVTAPGEDSAATGLDGEQSDSAAADSGAVYLFH